MKNFWTYVLGVAVGIVVGYAMWRRRKRASNFVFAYLGTDFNYPQVKSNVMAIIFKPNQFARVQIQPVDRKGNTAKVEPGSVDYSSPDPSFTVEEDPNDETILKITSSSEAITESKSVDIAVSADADTGSGVKTINGIITAVLEPEMAAGFGINVLEEPQDIT